MYVRAHCVMSLGFGEGGGSTLGGIMVQGRLKDALQPGVAVVVLFVSRGSFRSREDDSVQTVLFQETYESCNISGRL